MMNKCISLLATLLISSCTVLYFDKPMPEKADLLATFPAYLPGLYEIQEEPLAEGFEIEHSVIGKYVKEFLRLEPAENNTKMVVLAESRILVKDLPQIRAALAKTQAEGAILDFTVTDHLIYYETSKFLEDGKPQKGGQYITLNKDGDYLIIAQSTHPGYIFDLGQKTQTEFEDGGPSAMTYGIYQETDSVKTQTRGMVSKSGVDALYFNLQDTPDKWMLIYIAKVTPTDLLLLHSANIEEDTLKANAAYYNAVTPFRKDGDNYVISPDNQQLGILLSDQKLFKRLRLHRISN